MASIRSKTKLPKLKSCYVLLNRNFLELEKTSKTMNNPDKYFNAKKISDCKTALASEVNKKNNYKLRKNEIINYSDKTGTEDLDSSSEFSDSSDDKETVQKEKIKTMKNDSSKTNLKKLRCLFCDKLFNTHMSYQKHKRSHASNPYKCILCLNKWENRQSFLIHMKRYHPEVEPFICDYRRCDKNFKTQKLLEIHRKMHFKYMCKYCKKLFVKKNQMRQHVAKHH